MVKYTSQLEIRNWKLKIGIWELKCAVFFFIYLLLFSSDGRRKKEEEEKKKRRRKKKENEVLIPGSQVPGTGIIPGDSRSVRYYGMGSRLT